jgi:hypothetical protein
MVRRRLQHGGQVCLELLHRGAEIGDLLALEAEEQLEQLLQLDGVGHVAAQHLFLVLDEHGGAVVAEDDVVLRVALLELLGDLFVQVVGGVLGLPVAQRHAQLVQAAPHRHPQSGSASLRTDRPHGLRFPAWLRLRARPSGGRRRSLRNRTSGFSFKLEGAAQVVRAVQEHFGLADAAEQAVVFGQSPRRLGPRSPHQHARAPPGSRRPPGPR